MWVVYSHTNKITGKIYIGITSKKPEIRWKKGGGYIRSKHFYSAIQKYGWDSFEHSILLEGLTEEQAKKEEQKLIRKNKRLGISYNITDGGDGNVGWKMSDETREKIAKAHYGKKLSEEHKKHISESGKGRIVSDETRAKISKSKLGHEVSNETINKIKEKNREYFKTHESAFKGKHHTEESIRLNILHQKRTVTYMYDIFGNLIRIYNSKAEISREHRFTLSSVNRYCKMNKNKKLKDCKVFKDYIFSEQRIRG